MHDDFYTKRYDKVLFQQPILPSSIVEDQVAATVNNAIVSSATPMERIDSACSTVQNGGDDSALFPVEAAEKVD